METWSAKPRLRALLDHLGRVKDSRQSWKVAYPLREVLFLVVCGTIASGDDYDDIVDWGEAHLPFLRRFLEFYHGIPCADWLRTVMNRIDPDLFAACFSSWVAECWPDRPNLVAIDGKTSRRSHDRKRGHKALHLVSAFATTSRLVLGQEAVDEKSNEITAIPALLQRIDLNGALVSIDAMGCHPAIAQNILDVEADYLLAVKDNQPTLHSEVRSHSRLRAGYGAKNMAVVRHFALNLVRHAADKRSIKRRRKRASWDPDYLLQILGPLRC